ncbi:MULTISPECIES: DUF4266 domain-containing protein [unclassified Undibacterium]|jgi:hypothetical protein|uniref:DUF4266 domain-containing protein n=1 Tax=unclassified Undibacterium TaxID=2630295 RepID=UPI001331DA0C|nr:MULTISPECIES: DUF4266 domain-containing protein [unclassified Undibacterium]BBB61583.1 hypothetical protein UNDKW_3310 [Undibacterium sp. KW1]BBB67644.1 hypothetical protein UNDYM_3391 [Undibacterium sp. YM2]
MKVIVKKTTTMLLIASAALALSACGTIKPVQPWEKGNLAKTAMTFENDRLESRYGEHIYTSRESASGGAGVGGGGCGCN